MYFQIMFNPSLLLALLGTAEECFISLTCSSLPSALVIPISLGLFLFEHMAKIFPLHNKL